MRSGSPSAVVLQACAVVLALGAAGGMAAVVVPRLDRSADTARTRQAAKDLRTLRLALDRFYHDLGVYPPVHEDGWIAGLHSPAGLAAPLREAWKGPYLDGPPPSRGPWNGQYRLGRAGYEAFDHDDRAGNEVYLVYDCRLQNPAALDRLDERLDDGDRTTGLLRHAGDGRLYYYVGEELSLQR